jgi:hypothetical protein
MVPALADDARAEELALGFDFTHNSISEEMHQSPVNTVVIVEEQKWKSAK